VTNVHVIGTGGHKPGEPIPTSTIERLVGPLPENVRAGMPTEQRYWMIDPETGEHHDSNSGMALKAAVQAIKTAGVDPHEITLMILATGTPDYPLPPVVNLVQEGLGLAHCTTLELRSGGAGVGQALDIARMYLEAGVHRTALIIGSEAISPILAPVYLGRDSRHIRMRDRMPVYMFGDGAGAMILQSAAAPGGLHPGASACVGGMRKAGIKAVGGGTHAPISKQLEARRLVDLQVDVVGAGDFTPVMITEAIHATLSIAGVDVDTIDACILPEGNAGWMLESLVESGLDGHEWRSLEGKIVDSLATIGAVGCAAVPLFLDDAWRAGRLARGSRLLLIGVESTKWIYAGSVLDWTLSLPTVSSTQGSPLTLAMDGAEIGATT